MIKSFPKIFAIGTDYIKDIFNSPVEITEKVDGSQFCFGKIDGELLMRSKGQQLFIENPEKMFNKAMDYIESIQDKVPDNTTFYCEYLKNPKHNTLTYDRIPKNHLILYGVSDNTGTSFKAKHSELKKFAKLLDIEVVPLIHKGKVKNAEELKELLERKSILGDVDIEGIVVKNYKNQFLLGGQPIPIMMGKYVSEKFKEIHREKWGKENTTKGKWESFVESFKTEARWEKSVQHLRDEGKLVGEPKDIGILMKAIKEDVTEEEKETIKDFLWKEFGSDLLKRSTGGFPEWYKNKLLEKAFKEE